jgi:DNA/RNA non-specific endonuclease
VSSAPSPQPPDLATLLAKLGKPGITLSELMQLCKQKGWDHRSYITGTVGSRTSFWRRIKTMQHDPERVMLMVRPANPPPAALAGQHLADENDDADDVSKYMDDVLDLIQPCPNVPQHVRQIAEDEYKHYQVELAKAQGGATHSLLYKVDGDGRTISVSGVVRTHAQRDKDTAPAPFGGDVHKEPGDHKGHLYAATFASNPKSADAFLNVVWEKGVINLSYKKRFENAVAAFAEDNPGCIVTTLHEPLFRPDEGRPFAMQHYVVVDGVVVGAVTLKNE